MCLRIWYYVLVLRKILKWRRPLTTNSRFEWVWSLPLIQIGYVQPCHTRYFLPRKHQKWAFIREVHTIEYLKMFFWQAVMIQILIFIDICVKLATLNEERRPALPTWYLTLYQYTNLVMGHRMKTSMFSNIDISKR